MGLEIQGEQIINTWVNNTIEKGGINHMANIKEEAQAYEPPQTKNIADLEAVPVNLELEDREGTNKEGKDFQYKVVVVEEEDYRIPGVVLGDLKEILKVKPDLKFFKVTKKGTGVTTKYTVIPLDEPKEVKQ